MDRLKITYLLLTFTVLVSCTEPYTPETITYEEALVVESTITNEYKYQQVKLSRIVRLESENFNTENNAQVWINDSNENSYTFTQNDGGIYISDNKFKAISQTTYKLHIKTQNGNEYISKSTLLAPQAPITNVYVEKVRKSEGLGVQVYVDNENNNDVKYFRYEFKETYKIVTPYTIYYKLKIYNVRNLGFSTFRYSRRIIPIGDDYSNICYSSDIQKRIIQTSIENSTKKNIIKFPVCYIKNNNFKIRDRYSINIKQYTQSLDSYNYYKVLNNLGSVESLLSETQAGFVQGNITSNKTEKIIGFFDASFVFEKRIFFSYQDFNFEKPKYPYREIPDTLDYEVTEPFNERYKLYQHIELIPLPFEFLKILEESKYIIINSECSNCTSFASKEKPEFWID